MKIIYNFFYVNMIKENSEVILFVKNLIVNVEGKEIFKGFNLEIKVGEIYVIMGLNGFGKSIFFKVLVGYLVYEVIGGEVIFLGKNLFDMELEEWLLNGVFLVF